MAAATVSSNAAARPSGGFIDASFIPIKVVASSTTYTAATGGLPFDIATLLNNVGPEGSINPTDVIGIIGITNAGYSPSTFAVGTVTYNTTTDTSFRTNVSLATCPCTMKLWNGTTQFSDGACSETFIGFLVVQRGGGLNQ